MVVRIIDGLSIEWTFLGSGEMKLTSERYDAKPTKTSEQGATELRRAAFADLDVDLQDNRG